MCTMAWKIPYEILAEYVVVINKILAKTFDEDLVKEFFHWYYKNQKNYPDNVKLKEYEYDKIRDILIKETAEPFNLVDCICALRMEKFESYITSRTKFMLDSVDEFFDGKEFVKGRWRTRIN